MVSTFLGNIVQLLVRSIIISFILATLFPCWLAQMLPEMLATRRSIKFIQLPLSFLFTTVAVKIAHAGAGLPGIVLFNRLSGMFGFTQIDNIGVGDAALFDRASTSFGLSVSERIIHMRISKATLVVEDTAHIDFSGTAKTSVDHVVRIALPHSQSVDLKDAKATTPTDIVHTAWKTRSLRLDVRNNEDQSVVESDEIFLSLDTTIDTPIPRDGYNKETIVVSFFYEADPLSLDDNVDDFYFDISKPTKLLKVLIECDEDLFVVSPQVLIQPQDELVLLGERRLRELEKSRRKISREKTVTTITVPYPPLASRFLVLLDARVSAPAAAQTAKLT